MKSLSKRQKKIKQEKNATKKRYYMNNKTTI